MNNFVAEAITEDLLYFRTLVPQQLARFSLGVVDEASGEFSALRSADPHAVSPPEFPFNREDAGWEEASAVPGKYRTGSFIDNSRPFGRSV